MVTVIVGSVVCYLVINGIIYVNSVMTVIGAIVISESVVRTHTSDAISVIEGACVVSEDVIIPSERIDTGSHIIIRSVVSDIVAIRIKEVNAVITIIFTSVVVDVIFV